MKKNGQNIDFGFDDERTNGNKVNLFPGAITYPNASTRLINENDHSIIKVGDFVVSYEPGVFVVRDITGDERTFVTLEMIMDQYGNIIPHDSDKYPYKTAAIEWCVKLTSKVLQDRIKVMQDVMTNIVENLHYLKNKRKIKNAD